MCLVSLSLVVDFEPVQQSSELSGINESIVSSAADDEELQLLLSHPVSLVFLSCLADVQLTTSVLLHHVFRTDTQQQQCSTTTTTTITSSSLKRYEVWTAGQYQWGIIM